MHHGKFGSNIWGIIMIKLKELQNFYNNKTVLVTGHTGFKGSWLSFILDILGANVIGYALKPSTGFSLYEIIDMEDKLKSYIGDVRDLEYMKKVFETENPEIVIHMAAQPIVRESYKDPVGTYATNVMGTVNVLECIRKSNSVQSFLNVTTDKVYKNKEWEWGYREEEELCGYDPYSNSKSCSELITYSYQKSFLEDRDIAISTARAGNVIGGGDFSVDRIIPDCFRAAMQEKNIIVRNPKSVRPYQHVLEPIMAYLQIVSKQYMNKEFAGNYNIGPDEVDCICTGELVSLFCQAWKKHNGQEVIWEDRSDGGPHEAAFLKLDCARFKKIFGWKPAWHINTAIDRTVEWYSAYANHQDIKAIMQKQLYEYIEDCRE